MRTKLVLAAIAAAASFAPLTSASAYCDAVFYAATGYCNPCYLVADVTNKPMNCLA